MEFVCKDCKASLSGDVAFVPSRKHFPARFDRIEILKNVHCGECVRWRDIKNREVVPLFDMLAILDQQDVSRNRQKVRPSRQPIKNIVRSHRTETRQAASRRRQAEAERTARRAEANKRYDVAIAALVTGHNG